MELNAFTSSDFIKWIESKLKQHGIKKVVPDAETLETAYRRALQIELIRQQLPAIISKAGEQAQGADDSQGPGQDGPQGLQGRFRPIVG